MTGFVVYKDYDGWFRWINAAKWDEYLARPYENSPEREEIGRFATLREAKNVRHAYNMMVHGKPTQNDIFNALLEQRNEAS